MSLPLLSAAKLEADLPTRRIASNADIPNFERSEGYRRIVAFVDRLNDASRAAVWTAGSQQAATAIRNLVKPPRISRSFCSKQLEAVVALLGQCKKLMARHPPLQEVQRFGNRAFKTYIEEIQALASKWHDTLLEHYIVNVEDRKRAISHLLPYFNQAWGSGVRIDYGSGHELSFVCWLCGLYLLGFFARADAEETRGDDQLNGSDESALALYVYSEYLELVRDLQKTYRLEPAGSHGVWGLDDYQALCYLFGSAQLIDQPSADGGIEVAHFLNEATLRDFRTHEASGPSADFLFFEAVRHVRDCKKGPFAEHSPVLYSVATGVKQWAKVNSGMRKMWIGEVLGKAAVVQHLPLGSQLESALFPWCPQYPSTSETVSMAQQSNVPPPVGGTKAPWHTASRKPHIGLDSASPDSPTPASSTLASARKALKKQVES